MHIRDSVKLRVPASYHVKQQRIDAGNISSTDSLHDALTIGALRQATRRQPLNLASPELRAQVPHVTKMSLPEVEHQVHHMRNCPGKQQRFPDLLRTTAASSRIPELQGWARGRRRRAGHGWAQLGTGARGAVGLGGPGGSVNPISAGDWASWRSSQMQPAAAPPAPETAHGSAAAAAEQHSQQYAEAISLCRALAAAAPLPVVCINPSCESLAEVSEAAAACLLQQGLCWLPLPLLRCGLPDG
ncbi:hypothetical protein COO60DRAFT_1640436 [Scenedesmus sp. NREL 46B-D3]|nr:hypothetical protein COO60DRAFT_1640436 [Scenedesmus sp. NREL 46B-D3]